MTSRKKLRRARRHTLGLLDEAATALDREEFALARKLLGRAVEQGFMNPRVHVEAAVLWHEMGRKVDAEAAVRRALELAPGFEMARELAGELGIELAEPGEVTTDPEPPAVVRTARSAGLVSEPAVAELVRDGVALLTEFLAVEEAAALAPSDRTDPAWLQFRALASEVGTLERGVLRNNPASETWLGELYACARDLAQALGRALGDAVAYPGAPPRPRAHVERCLWLGGQGGAGYPRRHDLGDRATMPLRALVALGPHPLELVLHDLRPGKPRRRSRRVPVGAAAWFTCRARPVEVAGVLGLQSIDWEICAEEAWSALLLDWSDVRAR